MKKLFNLILFFLLITCLTSGTSLSASDLHSNYNRFPNGITVDSVPILNTYSGNVFWVDSGAGSDGYPGTFQRPFDTVDYAIGRCTVNNGDIILVKAGHAENLATADAIDADIAGIRIIGLGEGTDRPTFTYTATAGEFVIGAANITIENMRFVAGISNVTMAISVEAAGDNFTLINCEVPEPDTVTYEFADIIDLASGADDITIIGMVVRQMGITAGDLDHFIDAGNGVNNRLRVLNSLIEGEFFVAAIWSDTADTEVLIEDCIITNSTDGEHAIEFTSTARGSIRNTLVRTDVQTTACDPGSMTMDNVMWDADATANTASTPVVLGSAGTASIGTINATTTDSLHGKIGTDTEMADSSLSDVLWAGAGIAAFPNGAAPANGVSIAEVLRDIWDAVRNGTGGSEPGTNMSVIDQIGTNDANNTINTSTVVENVDGSIYERLEALTLQVNDILAGMCMAGYDIGDVYYVDDATGSDADNGTSWALAEATIDAAIGNCTADKGDIIFVAPDHEETLVATQIAVDINGITIIGLGSGEQQPMIIMTDAASSIDVTGTDVTIENLHFYNTTADVLIAIDVDASGFILRFCRFTGSGAGPVICVDLAASLTDIIIEYIYSYLLDTDGGSFFNATAGALTNVLIQNSHLWGDCDDAVVHSDQVNLNVRLIDNIIRNVQTGQHAVQFSAATTGYIKNNILGGNTPGAILDPGSCMVFGNELIDTDELNAADLGMMNDKWYHCVKTFTLDGSSPDTLFTVTGLVEVKIFGHITTDWTAHADTASVGTADSTALLLPAVAGNVIDDEDVWTSVTVADVNTTPAAFVINDGDIIITQSGANLIAGVTDFHCYWRPLEEAASVVAN